MDKKDASKTTFSFPIRGEKPKIPSDRETEALAAMKAIKERVRHLKTRRANLEASGPDGNSKEVEILENELTRLKADWDMWEETRALAAKERMIRLGHEKGPLRQN